MYFADLISDFDLILVKASDLQISREIDAYYLGSLPTTRTTFFFVALKQSFSSSTLRRPLLQVLML